MTEHDETDQISDDEYRLVAKKAKLERIMADNDATYKYLQAKLGPSFSMNPLGVRLNLLIEMLTGIDLISQEMRMEFELAYHKQVQTSLNEMSEQVRQNEAAQGKGRNGIIIPNHLKG